MAKAIAEPPMSDTAHPNSIMELIAPELGILPICFSLLLAACQVK